jgi:hypothetical protein
VIDEPMTASTSSVGIDHPTVVPVNFDPETTVTTESDGPTVSGSDES